MWAAIVWTVAGCVVVIAALICLAALIINQIAEDME